MYANSLGNVSPTNNIYITLSINGTVVADSQSYSVNERGGSMSAPVFAGDTVSIKVQNHALDNMHVMFVPFSS